MPIVFEGRTFNQALDSGAWDARNLAESSFFVKLIDDLNDLMTMLSQFF